MASSLKAKEYGKYKGACYVAIGAGVPLACGSPMGSSSSARSSAEGTAAELAAPDAVCIIACAGTTSLMNHHTNIPSICIPQPKQHTLSSQRKHSSRQKKHLPLNLKPSNPRLRTNIPHQPLKNDLPGRVLLHLLIIILRILIISHPDELLVSIAAREDERCDAEDVFCWDFGG